MSIEDLNTNQTFILFTYGNEKEKSELREKIGIVIYVIVCFGAGVVFKLWIDGRL